jgi:hypothetical protein
MGFDIVYSERLTSSSNVRQNIPFVKSGLYLGIWKDTENDITAATTSPACRTRSTP